MTTCIAVDTVVFRLRGTYPSNPGFLFNLRVGAGAALASTSYPLPFLPLLSTPFISRTFHPSPFPLCGHHDDQPASTGNPHN